eukprot:jgi/Ulvmu1/1320/UM011_0048.1
MSEPGEPVYEGEHKASTPNCTADPDEQGVEPESVMQPDSSLAHARREQSYTTPTHLMLARLASRGVHVAESLSLEMSDPEQVIECENRDEALIKAFHALDLNGARQLSSAQLRGIVSLESPDVNRQQADQLLQDMDQDADGIISQSDWCSSWEAFKLSAPDSEFYSAICAITHGLNLPIDYDPKQTLLRHPANNRSFCNTSVARLLEQGLAETVEFLATLHVQVASKQLWEADGFLPPKFSQPCPVRFLGEWLRRHNPVQPGEDDDPHQLPWDDQVPLERLTPHMMSRAAFQHLDRPKRGFVALADVQRLVLTFKGNDGDALVPLAQLERALGGMDLEHLHDVTLEEFQELMDQLLGGSGGPGTETRLCWFDAFRPVLTAYWLSLKDWPSQLKCFFDHLVQLCPPPEAPDSSPPPGGHGAGAPDATGAVPAAQHAAREALELVEWAAVMTIARWKLRTHSLDRISAALGGATPQVSTALPAGAVALEPFCATMRLLFADTCAIDAANELAALMTGALELQPARGLPAALAARVRAHPLYARVPAMHAREVRAQLQAAEVSEVIGVDCRTGDEYDVSTALSALLCDMLQNPNAAHGWEADADALEEARELVQESLDMPTAGRPLVATFCTDGSRAALVALKLMELLPDARVVNITGGLLAWRGMGGNLEDPDGNPTEELHPFSTDLEPFLPPWPDHEAGAL